ncbi:hypothetical protein B0187_02755 [Haemophilus paracuniculus]|uniref:Glycosyl transferase family 25 domain-containing protein n=1 Tax=Haemophilus paracuniculus TaxID=734 RepID=A0A1T0ATR0_9PAST|nr:glycosyltransferase family 25 protein [Haemophilus paracuniculus]OOR99745.1 hypothetical protein B0187_02755 [Haemophilus paracuniculus]
MLQGYVINLDRHPQRLEKFNQHPDAKFFQRISAVDKFDLEKVGDQRLLFNTQFFEKLIHRKITFGEIACTFSHLQCWQQIAENSQLADQDFAIVAEDDILLHPDFSHWTNLIIEKIKTNPVVELVLLHQLNRPVNMQKIEGMNLNFAQSTYQTDNLGSALYLIRKQKAKQILADLDYKKPFWLADQFSYFCHLNHIILISELLGDIPNPQDSDLETERNIARREANLI